MSIRTRFAPSPTGYLHIGGARTALYSWLFAHKHKGVFVLRIEDTDLERSTPESVEAILEAMTWLGLEYQEGPFYQTQHFERYQAVAQQLVEERQAYPCYCSKERLEKLREDQLNRKEKPRYDGHCRNLSPISTDQPHVLRFRNPEEGSVIFEDQIRGELRFNNSELDDLIIVRTDKAPTYNFSVVVDDWDMKITHVIRGDDHINNTPRQINILKALKAELPLYAHVPMILGSDGKRLSKRHGAVSVMQYREAGFLPDALINYLVRLGWSHGDQEIFSRDEMIQLFDLKKISHSPAAFNPEKLLWLNQHYLKNADPNYVAEHLRWHMEKNSLDITQGPPLVDLIRAQAERCKTLAEMAEKSHFFYKDFETYDKKAVEKNLTNETRPALEKLLENLHILSPSDWKKEPLHEIIENTAHALKLPLGKVAQPLRVAVTGNTISPPIDETLALLGKEKTLKRIHQAIHLKASVVSGP